MRGILLALPFLLLACSSDDSPPATTNDADIDADYGDGPVTYRPDDGVDSANTEETSTDATSEAGDATTSETAAEASTDASSDAPETSAMADAHIHELYVDRNLEGDKVEYIEIAAPTGTPLGNIHLRIVKGDGSIALDTTVADTGTTMPSKGFWTIGASFTSPDKTIGLGMWGLPNDSGAVQLWREVGASLVLLDVVGYGTTPTAPATEPKKVVEGAMPAALPASGSTGKSIGRKSVPGDSDDNKADFCVMNATPGAANGACL